MNWNKLIRYSTLAFALTAVPVVTARGSAEARASVPGRSFSAAPSRPIASASSRGISPNSARSGNWNNRSGRGNWQNGNRFGNHGNHGHRHWRHRHFYPYYGYYPFGFGFGYPYFGSSFYYNNGYYNGDYYARNASGGSVVVNVQQELARAGYYRGAIDGVIGDGTRRAIRSYERANGLRVDGRIDSELLSSMGLG